MLLVIAASSRVRMWRTCLCSGGALQISDGSGIAERECFGVEGMCFIPGGSTLFLCLSGPQAESCLERHLSAAEKGLVLLCSSSEQEARFGWKIWGGGACFGSVFGLIWS